MIGERLRLLLLLPFPPRLDGRHGGSRATSGLLEAMTARHDVAVLFVRGPDDPPVDATLASRCALIEEFERDHGSLPGRMLRDAIIRLTALGGRPTWAGRWRIAALHRRVRELVATWNPDIVQAEFHVMGQYAISRTPGAPPFVLTQHESGTTAARESLHRMRGVRRIIGRLSVAAWNRFERALLPAVDAVVVFTDRDAAEATRLGADRVRRIALGVRIDDREAHRRRESVPDEPHRSEVLFVGNFLHPPNVDAAHWLARDIFPLVRDGHGSAVLQLVGAAAPGSVRALAGPGIDVAVDVPDVAPFLDRASVVVAPLRTGTGMRVKVLDALIAGKALVATPLAIEGLSLTHNEHVVVADGTEALASAVSKLLMDPRRCRALGDAAHRWAREHLDWARVVRQYEELYAELRAPAAQRHR